MVKIWANRLTAPGTTKTWADVPDSRKEEVLVELEARVEEGLITAEQLSAIIGE